MGWVFSPSLNTCPDVCICGFCVSVCATTFSFTVPHPPTQPLRGRDPVELLSAGCYVELQDIADSGLAWAAEVEENVGGRLKLRLLGTEGLPGTPATVWLFYLHPRLHPPGWAKEHSCTLRPPSGQWPWHRSHYIFRNKRKNGPQWSTYYCQGVEGGGWLGRFQGPSTDRGPPRTQLWHEAAPQCTRW